MIPAMPKTTVARSRNSPANGSSVAKWQGSAIPPANLPLTGDPAHRSTLLTRWAGTIRETSFIPFLKVVGRVSVLDPIDQTEE